MHKERLLRKGASVSSLDDKASLLPEDPKSLRVVIPLGNDNANYYALVEQGSNSLCQGIHLEIDEDKAKLSTAAKSSLAIDIVALGYVFDRNV